ncbi:MAG: class I SAM-dependent methyltransferase [Chitinophagaceae bacterium]|jgi:ubiquinone/menaquinone biosynthesis C-methylase UbiE|nr:class I SAM-dependent methyltransferase [Chitinophagaceae bacterium]OQY95698.1 MAG: methyltransferase type 11 [Sphingobacteriales bacterium UTBCD1]
MKGYYFKEIFVCEMCGDKTDRHKLLGQRLNKSQGFHPKKKAGISVSVFKCSNCGLIYSNPQPIPLSLQDHYGIPPESYWREEYFKIDTQYFSGEIFRLKKLKNFTPGMKALDVGAGIGKCMIALENAGFDTYGFEPSKPFYERAISGMHINEKKLKLGTIEEVEYDDNFFDFISFGAVFEHLYHPAASLEKAFRWLKPGGIIQMEIPSSRYSISKLINLYFRLKGTNYVTNLSPMHRPFHLYEFDLMSFQELSKRVGFKILFHEYYVCRIDHFPKIMHSLLKKYMKLTNTGMQLAVWLTKKT